MQNRAQMKESKCAKDIYRSAQMKSADYLNGSLTILIVTILIILFVLYLLLLTMLT